MRPPLMIGLALALGGTLWMSMQDDGAIEPVKAGASQRSRRAPEADVTDRKHPAVADAPRRATAGTGSARAGRAASGAEDAMSWEHRALIDGVRAWQQRQAGSQDVAMAQSAWASTKPPPPPKPVAQYEPPPPPPMAPPFPHKWIGRFNDEAEQEAAAAFGASAVAAAKPVQRAVVAGPSSTWVLKEGDVIEGQWRVDRIDNRTMHLTYLPLKLPQTVAMN